MAIKPLNGEFKPLAKPRLSLRRFVFYFITLAALVLIYFKFSEVRLIKELFARSNYLWLSGIVVLQVISYYFVAFNYRDIFNKHPLAP